MSDNNLLKNVIKITSILKKTKKKKSKVFAFCSKSPTKNHIVKTFQTAGH